MSGPKYDDQGVFPLGAPQPISELGFILPVASTVAFSRWPINVVKFGKREEGMYVVWPPCGVPPHG